MATQRGHHWLRFFACTCCLLVVGLLFTAEVNGFTLSSPPSYRKPPSHQNFPAPRHNFHSSSCCRSPRLRSALFMASPSDDNNPYYQGMDPYQILGVPRTADKSTIKAAFKKQVATWHPDKFPNDPVKKKEGTLRMEKINRAWYILGDDDRKRRYDTYGERGVGTSAASEQQLKDMGGPGFGGFGGGFGEGIDVGDLSDIFESFFGGGLGGATRGGRGGSRKNPNAPVRGENIEIEVEIPFMTAIFGGKQTVRVRRLDECRTCSGSGVKPGAKIKTCATCNGQGQVVNIQRTPFGAMQAVTTCPTCRGAGQEVEEYCGNCRGKGTISETADIELNIPVGVETGVALKVRDQGNAGRRGGGRGDIIAQLVVASHPKFERRNMEIHSEESISYAEAILGTTIEAETVDGKVEMKIPAGTQPGQKLRIRGSGAPKLGAASVRGDAIITIQVSIPKAVSGEEKQLVEKIAALQKKKITG